MNGNVAPGHFLAIMGPSGSGKTSLLNVLAGRVPIAKGAQLSGSITLDMNGEQRRHDSIAKFSAYVEQHDALFELSTTRETLLFAARFRLPELTLKQQQERVNAIIDELGLTACADTLIGSESRVRGLSGGERKRVSIGVDLLRNPPLVFLDEPTSGLDSFQANNVIETLRALASNGHTVLTSIHQPRSSIYQMMDLIALLSRGRSVYFGEAGKAVAGYFDTLGYAVPESFNPADFFLDTISVDTRGEDAKTTSEARVEWILDRYAEQEKKILAPIVSQKTSNDSLTQAEKEERTTPFHIAFGLLLRRTWREQTRDKNALIFKTCMNCFFSAMFGLVYLRMARNQRSLQDRTGILFFGAMNQAFGSSIGVSQVIPRQLRVVNRERASRMYRVLPYYVANFMVNLPIELLPQLVFGSIVYHMSGLRTGASHYMVYLAVMMLENLTGIALGMVLSSSFDSVAMAPEVAPAVVVLFLMFSGYFLNEENIPIWLAPLKYASFIRYAFTALCINEFKDASFECDTSAGAVCLQGNDWLNRLSFDRTSVGEQLGYLLIELCIFHAFAIYLLVRRRPQFLLCRSSESIKEA